MTFTLGIFDLFTYAIPGSLQLAFFTYLAVRLNLVELSAFATVPGWALAVGIAIVSYLLGQLVFLVAGSVVDGLYRPGKDARVAWKGIAGDAAEVSEREFKFTDPMLLLARVELVNREVAVEVSRLRATGLMLRSSAVPTALFAFAALAEIGFGPHRVLAAIAMVVLLLAAYGFAYHGRELRLWANRKTYQIAYWLDEIPASEAK